MIESAKSYAKQSSDGSHIGARQTLDLLGSRTIFLRAVHPRGVFRGLTVPGYEQGNFLGPTVLGGDIGPGIPAYDEEVFGPVLCCITVETLEDAIEIVNACEFGNGW